MPLRKYILIIGFLLSGLWGFSQELELVFQDKPLNQALIELRDRYNIQFSFDDNRLSQYRVTVKNKFPSPEKALDCLLKDFPLTYEKSGPVFLIYPRINVPPTRSFRLSGQLSDFTTRETLPYAHLQINSGNAITDQHGNFTVVSTQDSLFRVQASYLGYYLLDTLLTAGSRKQLLLKPFTYKLSEIQVKGLKVVKSLQAGSAAGVLRLNPQVAEYLPGYGDNSVFNLLRLQPGILAAGEQSNDLIIRGSYEGQSQVLLDGFTLFGMKNFNDNISAVNPFLAKDILVLKGGFPAEYGERVGGIVNITGADGDTDNVHLKASVNNMTLNSLFSLPVAHSASLQMAIRQTYYELYETGQISLGTRGRAGNGSTVDRYIFPDYNFRDLNLKFSGKASQSDSYSLSFMQGHDHFSYSLEYETRQANLAAYDDRENNLQTGASAIYNKGWKNGGRSELTIAWSDLQTELTNIRQTGKQQSSGGSGHGSGGGRNGNTTPGNAWTVNTNNYQQNQISEGKLSLQNHVTVSAKHRLGFGAGAFYNQAHFQQDSFAVNLVRQKTEAARINAYLEDHFSATPFLQFTTGLRTDYLTNINQLYPQPRISTIITLNKTLQLSGAWGLYRQYIARSSVIDDLGNYRYLWAICNNKHVPVQKSRHAIAGMTYQKDNLTAHIEGYQKKTSGLTRYIETTGGSRIYDGESKSRGIDFFVRKDYKNNTFWLAYTLSQTLEHFAYFPDEKYRRALHDQRHELKAATVISLKPFHFSANYVFGSGFPDPLLSGDENYERDYHRLDVAATYRLTRKKYSFEAGISILNVFDYENLRYANFIRVPDDQETTLDLHAEAVPFTPTMFVNFAF